MPTQIRDWLAKQQSKCCLEEILLKSNHQSSQNFSLIDLFKFFLTTSRLANIVQIILECCTQVLLTLSQGLQALGLGGVRLTLTQQSGPWQSSVWLGWDLCILLGLSGLLPFMCVVCCSSILLLSPHLTKIIVLS